MGLTIGLFILACFTTAAAFWASRVAKEIRLEKEQREHQKN